MTNLLFIHHSCGGMLLADPGEQVGGERGSGALCIYDSHPNGGGLRTMLQEAGYRVNELSYESRLGEDTDIHHWRGKFTHHMEDLLMSAGQDAVLPDGQRNRIVVFKSCFPNNDYSGKGKAPGDPDSPKRTIWNSKAAYNSLLPLFAKHPDVLFVALTAPPMTKPQPQGFVARVKALLKPPKPQYARTFNNWLVDRENGWLAGYEHSNIAVFDYYDVLTDGGKSDWSVYPTREGFDSHPDGDGNRKAALAFVPFLAGAVDGMK